MARPLRKPAENREGTQQVFFYSSFFTEIKSGDGGHRGGSGANDVCDDDTDNGSSGGRNGS